MYLNAFNSLTVRDTCKISPTRFDLVSIQFSKPESMTLPIRFGFVNFDAWTRMISCLPFFPSDPISCKIESNLTLETSKTTNRISSLSPFSLTLSLTLSPFSRYDFLTLSPSQFSIPTFLSDQLALSTSYLCWREKMLPHPICWSISSIWEWLTLEWFNLDSVVILMLRD